MADNTIVMFTADHGNMLGDHGRWFKGVMYEGSAHVPSSGAARREPRKRRQGRARKSVENIDVMPTFLEAAGLPCRQGVQGKSFVKLARGATPNGRTRFFAIARPHVAGRRLQVHRERQIRRRRT